MALKILIVEDEQDSREFLATFLKIRGYAVSTASDGLEAIIQVEIDCPDLIISDISMPNLDGIDLIKALRNSSEYRAVPVLVISAYGSGNLINAINAGANHAMRKPLNTDSLVTVIRELTEGG